MTNKEITAKIEAAGHTVPAGLNRAKLEALAAEHGVILEEKPPEDGSGTTTDAVEDGYDQNRLITPTMAVCALTGDRGADPGFPEGGGEGNSPAAGSHSHG